MSDQVSHVGREITIEALGKTWRFGRWTRKIWVDFTSWAKSQLPDPIEATIKNIDKLVLKDAAIVRELQIQDQAEIERAKKENRQPVLMAPKYSQIAETLTSKALDKSASYLSFNSPEIESLLQSVPGSTYLFFLLLRQNHPDISEDEACEVFIGCSQEEVFKILSAVRGEAKGSGKNEQAPPV